MGLERCGERQMGKLEPARQYVLCGSHAPVCQDGGRRPGRQASVLLFMMSVHPKIVRLSTTSLAAATCSHQEMVEMAFSVTGKSW
jgi:hypothetical protein